MERLAGLLGLVAFIVLAWSLSTDRKKINWKLVAWGSGMQIVFAILILPDSFFNLWMRSLFHLETAPGAWLFARLNSAVNVLLSFTNQGTDFLISSSTLGSPSGALDNFIFRVLPTILFFSAFMAVLYHLGLIQIVVNAIARLMEKTMKTSGAESLSAAANIFVGQTEAPLVVRPYVSKMTRSELLAVMTGGMATVSGGIMAAYVAFLSQAIPDIAGHLIAASVMSAPAALVMSKILIPETEKPATAGNVKIDVPSQSANVIDAAATGAADGVRLAVNVGAMLLVFIAFIFMLNFFIRMAGEWIGMPYLSLEWIFGKILSPLAWLMGVSWKDSAQIGSLLGKKTVINEFVAFYDLSLLVKTPEYLQGLGLERKSVIITTYALCGFSNFSSIAIQIGGIGGLAPERKADLARLGLRALLAGSLACFMTAAIAGILTNNAPPLMENRTNAGTIAVSNDSFSSLKTRLLGDSLPQIRESIWQANKNAQINWVGKYHSRRNLADGGIRMKFYFGIKNVSDVNGNEIYDFAEADFRGLPDSVTIVENGSVVRRRIADLKPGDPVRIRGKLSEFQAETPVLFRISEAEIQP